MFENDRWTFMLFRNQRNVTQISTDVIIKFINNHFRCETLLFALSAVVQTDHFLFFLRFVPFETGSESTFFLVID